MIKHLLTFIPVCASTRFSYVKKRPTLCLRILLKKWAILGPLATLTPVLGLTLLVVCRGDPVEELVWSGDGSGDGMEPPGKNPTMCLMLVATSIPRYKAWTGLNRWVQKCVRKADIPGHTQQQSIPDSSYGPIVKKGLVDPSQLF